jgi:hypothetical protein
MRTTYPLVVVIAIAMASMILAMSGWSANITGTPDTTNIQSNLNKTAENTTVGNENSGGLLGGVGALLGIALNSAAMLFDVLGLLFNFEGWLVTLGFPRAFAHPVSMGVYILASIGFLKFAAGRALR